MTQWYVKDISKLTGVSVQTLHHYDRIDLLKPSLRLSNGYRVYSETDLLRLQQIIALKFFGFELSQIKALLTDHSGAFEHFANQASLLEQKANVLMNASQTLKAILSNVNLDKSIPWETIIQLIEVYHMTQDLEHAWVKEIFTPEELKQYADFENEMLKQATPEQKANFEKTWDSLKQEIEQNLDNDPTSSIGIKLAERWMTLVNGLYGKKYAHLRTKKFERGFGEGKGLREIGLTQATFSWVEKALDAYWRKRINDILDQMSTAPSSSVSNQWNELLEEIYGDDDKRKKPISFFISILMSREAKKQ